MSGKVQKTQKIKYKKNQLIPDSQNWVRISTLMTIQIRIRIYQNNAGPHADPTPSFTHDGNRAKFFFTFIHSNASLQCFSFQ